MVIVFTLIIIIISLISIVSYNISTFIIGTTCSPNLNILCYTISNNLIISSNSLFETIFNLSIAGIGEPKRISLFVRRPIDLGASGSIRFSSFKLLIDSFVSSCNIGQRVDILDRYLTLFITFYDIDIYALMAAKNYQIVMHISIVSFLLP